MAYFSKEAYEGKERWARNRMRENSEVPTLSPEQHETLAWLCTIRHEMHCSPDSFWVGESGEYSEYWDYIGNSYEDSKINEQLNEVGLKSIPLITDTEHIMADYEVFEEWGVENLQAYYGLPEDYTDEDIDEAAEKAKEVLYELLEQTDEIIRKYLAEIDLEFGTNYCPGGMEEYVSVPDSSPFFRVVGKWWEDKTVEIIEKDGIYYGLKGWNGESFADSFVFYVDDYTQETEIEEGYIITPEYDDDNKLMDYIIRDDEVEDEED